MLLWWLMQGPLLPWCLVRLVLVLSMRLSLNVPPSMVLSALLFLSFLQSAFPRAWLPSPELHSPHPRALTPAGASRAR